METVLIVIHLMIVVALVGTVLLQRSEGGALGIGGGGGGLMTGRGAANALTRASAILAAAFFATSIALTLLASQRSEPQSILEGVSGTQPGEPAEGESGVLPLLKRETPEPAAPQAPQGPQVPQSQ